MKINNENTVKSSNGTKRLLFTASLLSLFIFLWAVFFQLFKNLMEMSEYA